MWKTSFCLIIFLLFNNIVYAQEKPKKQERFIFLIELAKGEALVPSYFEPPNSDEKLIKIFSISPELRNRESFINGGVRFALNAKNVKEIDFSSRQNVFSAGPVRGDVGFYYIYSKNKGILFQNKNLELIGLTRKQLGFFIIGAGLGSYQQSHFRISFIIGGAYTRNNIYIYTDNQLSNYYNNSFGEDALMLQGGEVLLSVRLSRFLVIEGVERYLVARENKQKVISTEQLLLSGKANVFIFKNLGLSVRGSYVNDPHGSVAYTKRLEAGLALKF
ncbi:MAG: hypothetical protein HYT62_01400 [Candidatus Yanofskybacteria bacterium]|nr:hypothetical protein [Candidatus Yanofskybacteria bacterium]